MFIASFVTLVVIGLHPLLLALVPPDGIRVMTEPHLKLRLPMALITSRLHAFRAERWCRSVGSDGKYIVPSWVKKYAYLSQPEEIWRALRVLMSLGT